jgi:hypothetical protein
MYRKGLTVGRIASLCGAVRETVGRHLRVQRAKFPDMQAEHEAYRPPPKPKPLHPSWLANIEELAALVEAGGRYPTSSDPDPERRRLGYWLSVQRRAHRDGRLSPAKLAALTALPGWNENQRLELARRGWQERHPGHPWFLVRTWGAACQECRLSHRHQMGRLLPGRSWEGVMEFFSASHCLAIRGNSCANDCAPSSRTDCRRRRRGDTGGTFSLKTIWSFSRSRSGSGVVAPGRLHA